MRDVARASGVTMPTLYHHFGSKRSLYLAACLALFDRWGKRLGAMLLMPGPAHRSLQAYFTAVADSLTRDRSFSSLLQRELLDRDAAGIRALSRSVFSGHFQQVTRLVRRAGYGANAALIAHSMFAMTFGMAQLQLIARELKGLTRLTSAAAMARQVLATTLPARPRPRAAARYRRA